MKSNGGFVGKVLRVDLSSGKISSEDTLEKYQDFLGGGTGIGYKVLWDEVPAGTKAWDPENRIVFACGALAGTGALTSGRTAITSLWPPHAQELVGSGHMGGHFAPELKFAGWDAIIIQGKAPKPSWLCIQDDKVSIKDASHIWGNGIYRATAEICAEMGATAQVAAIGQAGENLVRMSNIMTGNSHSAGGHGSVMGSKNLKAIGIVGTGSVRIAEDKKKYKELIDYILSLAGANNQWVVPTTPQPWAEFSDPKSRWTANNKVYWGAANPPVKTGTCDPKDRHSIAMRTQKAVFDFGEIASDYTVRMDGCHSCPIRCHEVIKVPSAEKYGVSSMATNTCLGWWGKRILNFKKNTLEGMEAAVLGKHMTDDLGLWDNYCLIYKLLRSLYEKGVLKEKLSEEEYKSIPWDKYENNNPEFIRDFCQRVAYKTGEFGEAMAEGSARLIERWDVPEEVYSNHSTGYVKHGHPKHHLLGLGQVGALINTQYNRDSQCHSQVNFVSGGLPLDIQKKLAEDVFGSGDAVDSTSHYTPMNKYKARFTKWCLVRKELHDSLPVCAWMFPWVTSPLKERGYKGDTAIESKLYSAITGIKTSEAELDFTAERIFTMHRVLTIRGMGSKNPRKEHDTLPDWVFHDDKGMKPFEAGTQVLDRADIETALDMFYEEMGWDKETGIPTRKTLQKFGLGYVADELEKEGLLPA